MKFDDHLASILVNNDIFKNIHPNTITFFGMFINFIIYFDIESNQDMCIFAVLIYLRWAADVLDGAVARKYKKTSKIGHILDTLSDIHIVFKGFMYVTQFGYITMTYISIVIILYMSVKYNMFESHINMKTYSNNIFNNIIIFHTNNTIITYTLFYIYIILN